MADQQGDAILGHAEDYTANLAALEERSVGNTTKALRSSLEDTLGSLRRAYKLYNSSLGETTTDPNGNPVRRPGSYSAAEAAAKFRGIIAESKGFLKPAERKAWEAQYAADLEEAIILGGNMADDLAAVVAPGKGKPFTGPAPGAINAAVLNASAYIEKESQAFRDQIVNIVAGAAAQGKSSQTMIGKVRSALEGVALDPKGLNQSMGLKQRAALIARSELQNVYNAAALSHYEKQGIAYVRWVATESERTCAFCVSRHGRIFDLKGVVIPAHPRCVLGDTKVSPGPLAAAFRSIYRGNVVTVRLANGESMTVTANHPVLTPAGWRKAEDLTEGDQLIGHGMNAHGSSGSPDLHEMPAAAEDVFAALLQSGAVSTVSVPVAPLDFHGDGAFIEGNVDVVRAEGFLHGYWDTSAVKGFGQGQGSQGSVRFRPLSTLSHSDAALLWHSAAANGSMSRLREAEAILGGGLSHAEHHRIATAAWRDPSLAQEGVQRETLYAELAGHRLDAAPGEVESHGSITIEDGALPPGLDACGGEAAQDGLLRNADQAGYSLRSLPGLVETHYVASVKIEPFHGYVYTFETCSGTYATGASVRIINRNCRCVTVPVPADLVEEQNPAIRDALLDGAFWRGQQRAAMQTYAEANKLPPAKARSNILRALITPTASERRRFPGIEESLSESVSTDAPGGGQTLEEALQEREAIAKARKALLTQQNEEKAVETAKDQARLTELLDLIPAELHDAIMAAWPMWTERQKTEAIKSSRRQSVKNAKNEDQKA
jgi:SPP1 gp7 family putative phage head morphogenesis protein